MTSLPSLLAPPLRLIEEARRLAPEPRRFAEPFPDCDDCGNPCDYDATQCAPCREADAAAWAADDANDERAS
jgi:hypothetical protein